MDGETPPWELDWDGVTVEDDVSSGDVKGATALKLEADKDSKRRKTAALRNLMAQQKALFEKNLAGQPASRLFGLTEKITALPDNEEFSAAGQVMLPLIRPFVASSSKEGDSNIEMLIFNSYIPSNTDSDQTIRRKFKSMEILLDAMDVGKLPSEVGKFGDPDSEKRASAAVVGASAQPPNGGNPPPSGPQFSPKIGGTFTSGPGNPAGFNAETAEQPMSPEYQAKYEAWIAERGRGKFDPQDYAVMRMGLDREFGFGVDPDTFKTYMDEGKRINDPRNNVNLRVPGPEVPLSTLDNIRNKAVANPYGAYSAGALNAGGLGIPALMAPDQYGDLREDYPVSSMGGEFVGSLAATGGMGAGIRAGAQRIGGRAAERFTVPNSMTAANLGFGTTYGATSNPDDPALGAFTGLTASALGDAAGRAAAPAIRRIGQSGAANRARGLFGRRAVSRVPDVSRAEQIITKAIGDKGPAILADLGEAGQLGVPMMLADSDPALRSLAGAAVRRSPESKGIAEDALKPRFRGQYDRLLGAMERDIGPSANIPQTSDDLIKRAQADSAPLYEKAFGSSGASAVDVADVLQTPAGKAALARARTQMMNDMKDPTTLGVDLDDAGEAVLTRVPSFETLDYVKRGFDDIASEGRTPFGTFRPNAEQASAAGLSKTLRGRMDSVNPAYRDARAAYAGPAGEREAFEMGAKSTNQSPDAINFTLGKMPDARQSQYKLGGRSTLFNQAGNVRLNSDPFKSMFGSPNAIERAGIYSEMPGGAGRLRQQIGLEERLQDTNNQVLGNSLTAERGIADAQFGMSPGGALAFDAAGALATGAPPYATALRMAPKLRDAWAMGLGKQKANELAPILFNESAADAAAALKSATGNVRKRRMLGNRAKRKSRTLGQALTTPLGPILIMNDQ